MSEFPVHKFVSLVSSDGHRFVIPYSAALGSVTLTNMLNNGFQEQVTGICPVSEHRAEVVEKVAEYLMYKETYSTSTDPIPDFSERVPPEIALELLMASDFLEV